MSAFTPPRVFPQQLLIGAEAVLARLIYEKTESLHFTPLALGEILKVRAFSATGDVNPLLARAEKPKPMKITQTDGEAHLALGDPEYTPKTIWSIIDGLDAVKWAYVFAGYALDEVAETWVSRFSQLARAKSGRLDMIKSLYDGASWRLVTAMRGGSTFGDATKNILDDTAWFRDFQERFIDRNTRQQRDRSASRSRSPKRATRAAAAKGGAKGTGKGAAGAGNAARWDKAWWTHSSKNVEYCRNFQFGTCQLSGKCPNNFLHCCAKCGEGGHGAAKCTKR